MRSKQQSSRGESLIAVLLAMAIVLVGLAAMAPALIRKAQVDNADAVAQNLNAILTAETMYHSTNQMYVNPLPPISNLNGNAALPPTCQNPVGLLMAQQTVARGYTLAFQGTGTPTGTCAGITGYSGYTITAAPDSKLVGTDNFLLSSADNSIRYADTALVPTNAPIFALPADLVAGSSITTPSTTANSLVTIWDPSATYSKGAQVLRFANIPGAVCTPADNGYVGTYVNLTNINSDPCTNDGNWFIAGSTPPSIPPPPPVCTNKTISGSIPDANIPTSGNWGWSTGISGICGTYTTFSVTSQYSNRGFAVAVQFTDSSLNPPATIWCDLNGNSCVGPGGNGGGASTTHMAISNGDNLTIGFSTNDSEGIDIGQVNWTLSP